MSLPTLHYFQFRGRALACRVALFNALGKDGWKDTRVSLPRFRRTQRDTTTNRVDAEYITNNLPQLDNSEYFADFDTTRIAPQRHLVVPSHEARTTPAPRTRIAVRWGDLWFAGVIVSVRAGLDAMGHPATVAHVLYDAAHGYRPSRRWHALDDEDWRRV